MQTKKAASALPFLPAIMPQTAINNPVLIKKFAKLWQTIDYCTRKQGQMARAGIFLTIKDLMELTGLTQNGAGLEMKRIKDALGKKPHQHLTITQYCAYEGISEDEVKKKLKRQ